jgi:hypothetical protein
VASWSTAVSRLSRGYERELWCDRRRAYAETGEEMSPSSSRNRYRVLITLSSRSTERLWTIRRARTSQAIAAIGGESYQFTAEEARLP